MSEERRLEVTIDMSTYADFGGMAKARAYGRLRLLGTMVLPLLAALIAAYICGKTYELPMDSALRFGGAVWLVVLLTTLLANCVPSPKYLNEDGALLGDWITTFNDLGVSSAKDGITAFYPWKSVIEIDEHGHTLFLMVDRTMAIMIPMNTFATDDAREEFIAYAETKIEAARDLQT